MVHAVPPDTISRGGGTVKHELLKRTFSLTKVSVKVQPAGLPHEPDSGVGPPVIFSEVR